MRDRYPDRSRVGPRLTLLLVVLMTVGAGCDGPPLGPGGRDWRQPASRGKERWTICCVRYTAADFADYARRCNELADMLRRGDGLRAKNVRVVSSATSSTVYYGQYVKVPSPETGTLQFPPEMQRDVGLIRQLTLNRYTPFARAVPELIEEGTSTVPEEWHVTRAKGRYTLQVAVFYNTPTFSERRQAAEDYVRLLRERGLAAYYTHEPARSFVLVGDFGASDVVQTEQGPRYGPRVGRFVAQNNGEFKYVTENLHIVKHRGLDGQMTPPPSFLIEVPRAAYATPWRR